MTTLAVEKTLITARIEPLETRYLLAGDPAIVQALPFALDFDRTYGTIVVDRDGRGTGFTWVQPNAEINEYRKGRLNLRPGAGILRIVSSGDNFRDDNTLTNGLQVQFAASSRAWTATTELRGPLTTLIESGQGAGIMFGPDQENFVRLAIVRTDQGIGLQFIDEQKIRTGYRSVLETFGLTNIGSLESINSLELSLAGNPDNGHVSAYYRVNGGQLHKIEQTLVLRGDKKDAFFSHMARAGILAFNWDDAGPTSIGFSHFSIRRGLPTVQALPPPSGALHVNNFARIFNDVRGGGMSDTKRVVIHNVGSGALTVSGINITGVDANQFKLLNVGSLPLALSPGQTSAFSVGMDATTDTSLGLKTASIEIVSSGGTRAVPLRGLATQGHGGANEPSLQRIMDLYQIPIQVGDSNPDNTFLDNPLATPNDEVQVSSLLKAGPGPVVIEPLAVFGVGSSTVATVRFGYYKPGHKQDKIEVLSVAGTNALTQTVNPIIRGSNTFDPGDGAFGLYALFPSMFPTVVSTPGGTEAYSEESLNLAYDPANPRKIKFYTLKDTAGVVVPNAYVLAAEDLNAAYDTNDFVAIIRNVQAAPLGPNIGFENLTGVPFSDRLVFNRIQNPDPDNPNKVHDTATLRIRNSGTQTLTVTSLQIASGWQIQNPPSVPFNIAPGGQSDVTIKFVATTSSAVQVFQGSLNIASNDPTRPNATVQLAGLYQRFSERLTEPELPQIIQALGYATTILGPGQKLEGGGKVEAVGDEILSPYWVRADTTLPVSVRQIGAWHTQGVTAIIRWFNQGSSTHTNLFAHDPMAGQSLFPALQGSAAPAQGSFTPPGVFGFKVDHESSDPTQNEQEQPGGGFGHHLRFWVLKDRDGNVIPDTYILAMDYSGINYDFNDNIYIISNIKPA